MIARITINLLILITHLISLPFVAIASSSYDDNIRKETESLPRFRPFSWQTQAFSVRKADFKQLTNQNIGYKQFDTTLTATIPCNKLSGLILSCGGIVADIDWEANQIFRNKSHYSYALLSAGGYTLALPRWNWSLLFSMLTDPQKLGSFNYNIYQLVVCGRYKASDFLELTMGVINEAGLRQEKAWPLVGISCKPKPELAINLIYPNNFSVDYSCSKYCHLGAAFRLIRFRKRLHANPILSKGVFEYENRGFEATLKIIPRNNCFLKAFGGIALGRGFTFADRKNQAQVTEKFKDSGYFGGNFVISF